MLLQESALAFRAMGTDCEIQVHAAGESASQLCDLGRERVELLEQSWSRFRPTSGLSLLNARAGRGPQPVSEDLLLLVDRMQQAWAATDGLFDPTVLQSMISLGYDVTLADVQRRPAAAWDAVTLASAPGMSAVDVDAEAGTVCLPAGVGLDPGAIGKGLAADVVADELVAAGAEAVLVNLGGDIALRGRPYGDAAWLIAVADEREPGRMLTTVGVAALTGGVATSTTLKRRWAQGRRHHVLDPRTGAMTSSDVVQASVVAPSASVAEVLATAALCLPSDEAAAWLAARDVRALLLTESTTIRIGKDDHHG
jgi:thiamine biosynthesis lipoprotein